MGLINRRNAVVGWAVVKVAKRVLRRKASDAVPRVEDKRPNKSALALAAGAVAGAVGGALTFWRRKKGGNDGGG
jgi:hypothetical protein